MDRADDGFDPVAELRRRRRKKAVARRRLAVLTALGLLAVAGAVAVGERLLGGPREDEAAGPAGGNQATRDQTTRATPAGGNQATRDQTTRATLTGRVVRFDLGDDAMEFIQEAMGEKSNLKPALQLRTREFGEIDCLFTDGQEDGLRRVRAGDLITVTGELHRLGGGVVILRNCRLR